MIRRIDSDLPGFKNIEFQPGLNVLLAERSPGATDKHTRNRAGKSSLLDVIHFLLGSNCDKSTIFRNAAMGEATFGMDFDLAGASCRIERTGSRPTPVTVAGDFVPWPIAPAQKGDCFVLSNDQWKTVLARLWFGLGDGEESWNPSVRSLLSYFVRREREGGMAQPMANCRQQRPVDQQVNISFLLGLDWTIARDWQKVREREKALDQYRKAMNDEALGPAIGSAASIKSEMIVAMDRVKRLKSGVESFQVVEQYHELEQEASRLTAQLAELADMNVVDRRYLDELGASTSEEVPPPQADLDALYREAGILLPDLVRRRFDDVKVFHESVVRNRLAYLQAEMADANRRINERNTDMSRLDARRSEVMNTLRSTGALEHFLALQGELSKAEARAQAIAQRYESAEALETGNLKLRVERAHLVERLHQDYAEQASVVEEAVLTFRDVSSELYEDDQAGTLAIRPTDNGPVFEPHMPGEKSKGVNNMRIFCFDMMLMLLSVRRNQGPGFLVHDSHLFDGVDGRQTGRALAVGATLAQRHGFQYIVTMNTDAIPREVPASFSVEEHALPVRLTDASESGGLFGFRFD